LQLIFAPKPSACPTYAQYTSRNVPERCETRAAIQGPLVARFLIAIAPPTIADLQSQDVGRVIDVPQSL
jgi:hypothetical protein